MFSSCKLLYSLQGIVIPTILYDPQDSGVDSCGQNRPYFTDEELILKEVKLLAWNHAHNKRQRPMIADYMFFPLCPLPPHVAEKQGVQKAGSHM